MSGSIGGAGDVLNNLSRLANVLITPYLAPIYDTKPDQIGSSFMVMWNKKPLLITAMHVLFGHSFKDDPVNKGICVDDGLKTFDELGISRSKIVSNEELDIAVVHIPNCPSEKCFPSEALEFYGNHPDNKFENYVSFYGFLARDFHKSRKESVLCPKPYLFTGLKMALGGDLIGVSYRGRARNSLTKNVDMVPIPKGLSGAVMFNTFSLRTRKVQILGVLTDQHMDQGFVSGPSIAVLQTLLAKL